MSACGRAAQWLVAIHLLLEMSTVRVVPDRITWNACISASEKGGEWDMAVHLLLRHLGTFLKFGLL